MKAPKLLLSLLVINCATLPAVSAIRTVDTLEDGIPGSLRYWLVNSLPNDELNFAVTGTITLTNSALQIPRNLTILGPGPAALAIDAHGSSRVFRISVGATVHISGLTIRGGTAEMGSDGNGGNIRCEGTLHLRNCHVTGGGYCWAGAGVFFDSTGAGSLTSCLISTNTTGDGGGVCCYSTSGVSVVNCTFVGNQIPVLGRGAAIYGDNISVRGCTVTGNVGDPHGAAIYSRANLRLGSTIVAGNACFVYCSESADVAGAFQSEGFNLIGRTNGSTGWIASDVCGWTGFERDAALGPLQDNGGPTWTMAPLPISLAIDNGNSFGSTTDQRGFTRPVDLAEYPNAAGGDGSDIGAVEVQPAGTKPDITTQPTNLTVLQGRSASFYVTANGTEPLSYQWRFNGANISGATTNSYTIPNVQSTNAGGYSVVVTNSYGSVTSSVASLTLVFPPSIFSQPINQTVSEGQDAIFTVFANGSEPLYFQWRFNGTNLPGGSTNIYSDFADFSYTVTNARPANAGPYTAVVTNLYGSVTSSVATLTVLPPPEIGVFVGGTNLTHYFSTVSFGTNQLGQTSAPVVFTVTNSGVGNLLLPGGSLAGPAAQSYVLDFSSMASTVPPGGSTTFSVSFCPMTEGTHNARLELLNNDADEGPFVVNLTGFVQSRVDLTFDPNVYPGGNITAAVQPDNKILIAGLIYSIAGSPRWYLARLNPNGTVDTGFNPNIGGLEADPSPWCLAIQPDGKILVGGRFTTVGGTTHNRLARLHADGTLDPDFNPDVAGFPLLSLLPSVYSLALQDDGKILVGGGFASVGGTTRNGIARLNADGTLDSDFKPDLNSEINSLAIQPDGKILLGGVFYRDSTRCYLGRLNADGTADPDFNPVLDDYVYCVLVQPDGKILVGGVFTTVNGTPRYRCARLDADGTLDMGFDPNVNGRVHSLALQADGKIVLGGRFGYVGTVPRAGLARLYSDGTLDPGFTTAAGGPDSVTLQADGMILLGGGITTVGGVTLNGIARLLNEPATQALTVPDGFQVQWLRGGSAPEVEQVTFEVSADGGTNWTSLGSGTRMAGGWTGSGVSLPPAGMIRARGRAAAGIYNGSSSLFEQVASYRSRPILTQPTWLPNRRFQLTLTGASGESYIIQAATNVTGAPWVPLFTNPSPFTFTDPNASNYTRRFYRAITP